MPAKTLTNDASPGVCADFFCPKSRMAPNDEHLRVYIYLYVCMCVCMCGDLLAIPSARIAQKELAEVSQQHFFAVVIATSVGILRVGVSRSFLFSNST